MNPKKLQQPVGEFPTPFACVPWGHHIAIISKCKSIDEALFFVRKTWENQWGRGMLVNFLDTDLYEREGKALSKFSTALLAVESDFAQQLIKDPYHFEFLQLNHYNSCIW